MLLGGVSKFWKGFFRTVALCLITVMLAQDIAQANPTPGIFQHAFFKSFDQAPESPVVQGKKVQINSSAGKLLRSFKGKQSVPVFLIQDAHYHFEAQENAASSILQLIDQFDIRAIGVEGASGKLWHDWATRYPDIQSRRAAFKFWLSRHEIGAAEYAAGYAGKKIQLSGLENAELYSAHLAVNREILSKREMMESRLAGWRRVLRALISQAMPADYIRYTAAVRSDRISDEFKQILTQAQNQNVDLKAYPQVEIYSQLEPAIEKLNGPILMREMRAIPAVDVRAGLLQLALQSSPGAIGVIQKKMETRGFAAGSPNIMSWLKLLKLTAGLNENMLGEFQALDRDLRRSYLKTGEQVWLDRLSRWTDLMESWQKLEWTPEDAALYESEHVDFLSQDALARVKSILKNYSIEKDFGGWQTLFERNTWNPWLQFYSLALQRDAELAKNAEHLLKQGEGKPVLIYAGGFHTPGLERDLRRHSVSFVTIRPVVKREQERLEKAAYEQAIEGNSGFFGKILNNSMNAAQRSKNIPFELQTPRKFPALSGETSGEPAAFLLAGSAILTALSAASGRQAAPVDSGMQTRSVQWWSSLTVSHRNVQANGGSVEMFSAGLGSASARWKKSTSPMGGAWMSFGNIGIQISASLVPDAAVIPQIKPVSFTGEGLANLLPSDLLKGRPEPQLIKKNPAVAQVSESRSEVRKEVTVKPRSFFRTLLAALVLGAILGPVSAFAQTVKASLSPVEEVKAAVTAIQTSRSNIGPGTSRKIKGHAPEWQLIQNFQTAYLRLTANPNALGPQGADGTWGYSGSFTDLAMSQVKQAIAAGNLESLAPAAVVIKPAIPVPSSGESVPDSSSNTAELKTFQMKLEPLMQQADTAIKALQVSSEASPLPAGVKGQIDLAGTRLNALKLFLEAQNKKGPSSVKQSAADAQAKLSAYAAQFAALQKTISSQAESEAALKAAQLKKTALDHLQEKISEALSSASTALAQAETLIQPGQDPTDSDLALAESFYEVISKARGEAAQAGKNAPEMIKTEASAAAQSADGKIAGFLDRAGQIKGELAQSLENAKNKKQMLPDEEKPAVSPVSEWIETFSDKAAQLIFQMLQWGPVILAALAALGLFGFGVSFLRKKFKKTQNSASPDAFELTSGDRAFLKSFPSLEKAKDLYYPQLIQLLQSMESYSKKNPQVLMHSIPSADMEYAEYFDALSGMAKSKEQEIIPQALWVVPVVIEAVIGAALFYIFGFGLMPILAVLFSIRAAWTLTALQNEWGHMIAAAFKGERLTLRNFLGGHSFFTVLFSFIPLMPALTLSKTKFENAGDSMGFIQKAGWGIGGVLTLAMLYGVSVLQASGVLLMFGLPVLMITAGLSLVLAFYSDFINPPEEENCALCGNISYGSNGRSQTLDTDDLEITEQQMRITMLRGGQAGGSSLMARGPKGMIQAFRYRMVSGRRTFLPQALSASIRKRLGKLVTGRVKILQSHFRFGTASDPAVEETHPHQGAEPTQETRWVWTGDDWKTEKVIWSNTITHNGDFDRLIKPNGHIEERVYGFKGKTYSFSALRRVLQHLMNVKNTTQGDSPVIALMIDLLHAKGNWGKSILYGYMHALDSFEDLYSDGKIPETMKYKNGKPVEKKFIGLTEAERMKMAAAWEIEWQKLIRVNPAIPQHEIEAAFLRFLRANSGAEWGRKLPQDRLEELAKHVVHGFLNNDLYAAVREFMQHADGSFGLVVTSTAEPKRVVFASRYQPLSMGFDYEDGTKRTRFSVVSEAFALKARTRSGKGFRWRFDLDQTGGEIMELTLSEEGPPRLRGFSIASKKELTAEDILHSGRFFDQTKSPYISKLPLQISEHDWVRKDLEEMGLYFRLVDESHDALIERNSLNVQTQRAFAGFLLEKSLGKRVSKELKQRRVQLEEDGPEVNDPTDIMTAAEESFVSKQVEELVHKIRTGGHGTMYNADTVQKEVERIAREVLAIRSKAGSNLRAKITDSVDVLIYGEENSYEAALAFAESLREATGLRVKALKANFALRAIKQVMPQMDEDGKYTIREFVIPDAEGTPIRISRNTLALGISHSGETFATAMVTSALRKVIGNRVFIQTGEVDSRMAVAIGQGLAHDAPWLGRIITSFPHPDYSSLRPSEAASLVPLLQQHTLSRFLLGTLMRLEETLPNAQILNIKWSHDQVQNMWDELTVLTNKDIPAITGFDVHGKKLRSKLNETIKTQYRKWEKHLVEGVIVWLMSAGYILLTVPVRMLYFPGLEVLMPHYWIAGALGVWATGFFYVFLGAFMAWTLRAIQRRELFRRLGVPAIVTADAKSYVFNPAAQFAIKLFSLSPAITDPAIYRGDALGDVGHTYAPLTRRGTLVQLGLTDPRKPDGEGDYESARLSGTQTKGVKSYLFRFLRWFGFKPTGAEVLAVGHSGEERANSASHEIHLHKDRKTKLSVAPDFADYLVKRLGIRRETEDGVLPKSGILPPKTKEILKSKPANDSSELAKFQRTMAELATSQEGMQPHARQEQLVKALGSILHLEGKDLVEVDAAVRDYIDHQLEYLQFHSRHVDSLLRTLAMMQGLYYAVARIAKLPLIGWPLGQTQNRTKIATTATSVSAVGVQAVLDKIEEAEPLRKTAGSFKGPVPFDWGIESKPQTALPKAAPLPQRALPAIAPAAAAVQIQNSAAFSTSLFDSILALGQRLLDQPADAEAIDRWLRSYASRFQQSDVPTPVLERFVEMHAALEVKKQGSARPELRTDMKRSELRNLSQALSQEEAVNAAIEQARLESLLTQASGIQSELAGFAQSSGWVVFTNPGEDEADVIRMISRLAPKQKIMMFFDASMNAGQIAVMQARLKGVAVASWISGGISLDQIREQRGWTVDEIIQIQSSRSVDELPAAKRIELKASLLLQGPRIKVYGRGQAMKGVRQTSFVDWFETVLNSSRFTSTAA